MKQRPPADATRIYGSPPGDEARPEAAPEPRSEAAPERAPIEENRRSIPPAYVDKEITRYLQEALAKFGVPGDISIEAGQAILRHDGSNTVVPLGNWTETWSLYDEAVRRRFTNDAARALSELRPRRSESPTKRLRHADSLVIAGVAVSFFGIVLYLFSGPSTPDHSPDSSDTPSQGIAPDRATTGRDPLTARSSKTGLGAKKRIFQGATATIADIDGMVVEIMLLKQGGNQHLDTHPALEKFLAHPNAASGSKFIWPEEPDLATLDTTDSVVKIARSSIGAGADSIPSVRISFGGTLVDAYFSKEGRRKYYHIAQGLSDALQATHTALYARCFDDEAHLVGSWFRGIEAKGAATSLIYFMGTFATPIHIAPPFYKKPHGQGLDRHHAFSSITEHTRNLDRASLATVVGSEEGTATGRPGEPVIITFPFTDSNRAARVSRSLARVTSLAR